MCSALFIAAAGDFFQPSNQRNTQGFKLVDFLLLFIYDFVQHIDQIFLARQLDFDIDNTVFIHYFLSITEYEKHLCRFGFLQQGLQIRQSTLRRDDFIFRRYGIALIQFHFLDEARNIAMHVFTRTLALLAPAHMQ